MTLESRAALFKSGAFGVRERRERRVVRASNLIAFGHSGCRGGVGKEDVVGFVRHERRVPDVVRRGATDGSSPFRARGTSGQTKLSLTSIGRLCPQGIKLK